MSKEEQTKVLDKVQKLLKLGESPNEAEASLAVAKAHELLKQYNLSLSDIEVKDAEVVDETYMESGRTQGWRVFLMIAVANANYCSMYEATKYVGAKTVGGKHKTVSCYQFIGKFHNVAVCKAMLDYLFGAIDRMGKDLAGSGRSEIESYKAGISDTLCIRIRNSMKKEVIEEDSRALVVQEKAVIDKYIQDNLKLKTHKVQSTAQKNWDFYGAGRADGNKIGLNDQLSSVSTANPQLV